MSTGAGSMLGAVGLASFTAGSATPSVALSEMKYPSVWRSSSPTDVWFSKRKRSLAQATMRVHDVGGMGRAAGKRTLLEVSCPVAWESWRRHGAPREW